MAHTDRKPQSTAVQTSRDDFCGLYERCPAAVERIERFRWEWIADHQPETREWIRRKRKPVTVETGINTLGLLEAAREVATHVQVLLRELPTPLEPLVALELADYRRWYLEALVYLDPEGTRGKFPSRNAKAVEAQVSPDGRPVAICVGSAKNEFVPTIVGLMRMQGYEGCLNTFPDPPYGRGSRWPRLCPRCQTRRTNARNKARRQLRRRVARAHEQA